LARHQPEGNKRPYMNAILHGTWIHDPQDSAADGFFAWAERAADAPAQAGGRRPRVGRHPYAATTIEIAQLLAHYVPDVDWRAAPRMTRVALLPSYEHAPVVPRWLVAADENGNGEPSMAWWRIEGIGIPVLQIVEVLAALPMRNHAIGAPHRVGDDLRFWGIVAKFGLEILAGQRYLPGIAARDQELYARWQPALRSEEDLEREQVLTTGMPPVCRAIFRERGGMDQVRLPRADLVLDSFLAHLTDQAVRAWSDVSSDSVLNSNGSSRHYMGSVDLGRQWLAALVGDDPSLRLNGQRNRDLTRFYRGWQGWSRQARQADASELRLCFRLEPPAAGQPDDDGHWHLRYLLQAVDDPSLMIPASHIWRERGDVLSYLNRRFDQPQERLLAGLGAAQQFSPAIRRSLKRNAPEGARLTPQEAYTFLRETARLLKSTGFGVLVPPWWSRPDARLRVRVRLGAQADEAAPGYLSMDRLISYDWELALGDDALSREEFERLAALKTPLVRMRGQWVLLQPEQVEAAIAFWKRQQARDSMTLGEALRLALGSKDVLDGLPVAEIELDPWLQDLVQALENGQRFEVLPEPKGFQGELRPYQVRGMAWLSFMTQLGLGVCLADDMGLGKTIQTIALLLHDKERGALDEPALVICPTSVVGNWRREVQRFGPDLRVMVHHGTGRSGGEDLLQEARSHDLVISTYGLAWRDLEDLRQVPWSYVFLDEAQNIKNPSTKQARAVRRLQGVRRAALTGTPVENRLSELWSIMSFLNPGYLGGFDRFRRNYAVPIERYQDDQALTELRTLVQPFILRRVKTDPMVIQDLPEKLDAKVFCNLTREQATLYEAIVRDAMASIEDSDQEIARRGRVLAMLTRLKQVCDHPALMLGDGSDIGRRSGKVNRLSEMLEEVLAIGDRALIFTQFAQMGHLLQRYLQELFQQEVLFLHGGTPQKRRDEMVMRFQEDPNAPSIFLLSLKAGGTGLNLMRANHVFHFDRWWNPAVENQATDRAYRIGQRRDVQVHKFVTVGTLEESIDVLIESKRELAENVIGAGEGWLTDLDTDALRELVVLREDSAMDD
jgi:SNF2 family DNA or RNA helicase